LPPNEENNNNIVQNIYSFIKRFHIKYNFNIIELTDNLKEEENDDIYDICKNFIDLIFIEDEIFINNLNINENDKNENEIGHIISNNEHANFYLY